MLANNPDLKVLLGKLYCLNHNTIDTIALATAPFHSHIFHCYASNATTYHSDSYSKFVRCLIVESQFIFLIFLMAELIKRIIMKITGLEVVKPMKPHGVIYLNE